MLLFKKGWITSLFFQNYKQHFERETGLEPATNSLEGCDSSQLSYSRLKIFKWQSRHKYSLRALPNKYRNYNIFGLRLTKYEIRRARILLHQSFNVGREGIEPPQALPTDLQSAPTLQLRRLPGLIKISKINEQQI